MARGDFRPSLRTRIMGREGPIKGCPCERTRKVMAALGATHAARMHAPGAASAVWSPVDWLLHMDEEEQLLLPLLPHAVAVRILGEHEVMRTQIRLYGNVDPDYARAHGGMEDDAVATYLKELF